MNDFEKLHASLWLICHVGHNLFSNFVCTIFSHANGVDLSDNK